MGKKRRKDRADRYGSPEGAESALLSYRDQKGERLSASDWLERVKADAKKKKT